MKVTGAIPAILAPFLYAFSIPVLTVLLIVNEILRFAINFALKYKYKGQIKLVPDGADGIWGGYGSAGCTRNVIVTAISKSGELDLEKCSRIFKEKVLDYKDETGRRPYEKFEHIFVRCFGYSCWKKCEGFNVKSHFRTLEPEKMHDKEDVQEILADMLQDMDEDKPQWEIVTIPKYRETPDDDEKTFQIMRFQHAYMDGLSMVLMMSLHLGENFQYTVDPLKFSIPLWKRIFFYVNFVLYAPYTLLMMTWSKFMTSHWVKTTLPSGKHNMTWTKDIPMDVIRKIRAETRATVPNVISTAYVIAAKKILPPERMVDDLIIGEIVAMLPYPNSNPQNRFTIFSYDIPTMVENPIDKIRRAKVDSLEGLIGPQTLLYYLTFKLGGRLPPIALRVFSGAYESIFLSNVPASKTKFKFFGADIEEMAAWPPQPNGTGITMASISYKGAIKICGVADESWLTKQELESIYEEMPKTIYSMAAMDYPNESTIAEKLDENENTKEFHDFHNDSDSEIVSPERSDESETEED